MGPEHSRPHSKGQQPAETAKSRPTQQEFSAVVLKPGNTALAQVIKATPATDAQRQRLTELYSEVTNRAEGNQPAKHDKASPLPPRLQALLQSPSLALVELKLQGQLQLALAASPLRAGQTVEVQQSSNGALQITRNLPPATSAPLATQSRLTQALKTALPQHAHSESLSGQLGKLQALQQLLQAHPSGINRAFKKPLLESIKQVLEQPASAKQLSQPENLKQQLNKAGPAMESQLKGLSNTQAPSPAAQPKQSNAEPALTTAPQPRMKPALPSDLKASRAESATRTPDQVPTSAPKESKDLLSNDFKALLLASLQLSQLPSSATVLPPKTSELDQALTKLLTPLLQQGATPATSQDMSQLSNEKLLVLLQHQLQKLLGRVQFQQLQALNKKLQSAEGGAVLQHLQLELPIRHGQELYSLTVQIDEKILYQEKEQDDERAETEREQVRQWQVKLAFELPEGGRLHAHLSIINDSVNASLWAENPQLLIKAREHLSNLRERMISDGLDVKTLDCFAGAPPLAAIELRYNLVDVKT